MIFPKGYCEDIVNFLGEKGQYWLDDLPRKIDEFKSEWLIDTLEVCQLSYNYVAKGTSEIYGPVILKLCLPGHEYDTELHALSDLNTDLMCDLLGYDYKEGVLLLEALSPGDDLWQLKSIQERLDIAGPLIDKIPAINKSNKYPTHEAWVKRILGYIKAHFNENPAIVKHLNHVLDLYETLDGEDNPKLLLHGDLHHGNILKSQEWLVIDPKGVIGHKSLEVGRYMNNQIQESGIDRDVVLEQMVQSFALHLNLDRMIVLKSFYIDMVLSTSWNYEDDQVNFEAIDQKVEICQWLLGKIDV